MRVIAAAAASCSTFPCRPSARRSGGSSPTRFSRIGKRIVSPPEIRAGANAWRYRRKLTLALRRSGSAWTFGLHAYDDPSHVFSRCRTAASRTSG